MLCDKLYMSVMSGVIGGSGDVHVVMVHTAHNLGTEANLHATLLPCYIVATPLTRLECPIVT